MGSGEDDVSENRVTFMDGLFIGVFFVGAAGNGWMVISAVTEAPLSPVACLALIAGGLVLLALLFSTLALAVKSRRLKQEAALKTEADTAEKEPEQQGVYKPHKVTGLLVVPLFGFFVCMGMSAPLIVIGTDDHVSIVQMGIGFGGFWFLLLLLFWCVDLGPPWAWIRISRRSWAVIFSVLFAPLRKNIMRITFVFLALIFVSLSGTAVLWTLAALIIVFLISCTPSGIQE